VNYKIVITIIILLGMLFLVIAKPLNAENIKRDVLALSLSKLINSLKENNCIQIYSKDLVIKKSEGEFKVLDADIKIGLVPKQNGTC